MVSRGSAAYGPVSTGAGAGSVAVMRSPRCWSRSGRAGGVAGSGLAEAGCRGAGTQGRGRPAVAAAPAAGRRQAVLDAGGGLRPGAPPRRRRRAGLLRGAGRAGCCGVVAGSRGGTGGGASGGAAVRRSGCGSLWSGAARPRPWRRPRCPREWPRSRPEPGCSRRSCSMPVVAEHPLDLHRVAAEVQLDLAGEVGGDVDLGLDVPARDDVT